MSQKLDFIGLNIYHSRLIRAGQNGPEIVPWPVGHPHTLMSWPVTPQAHYWGPRFFVERYGKKPVYIFESGMSLTDVPTPEGQVHDPQRIAYHAGYLREFARAGQDGVPIAGYFVWSFLDVMEWSDGYKNKFGLVYIDHSNQLKRIPKDSYYWYQKVIQTRGEVLA
jgi:beta-glucosidase